MKRSLLVLSWFIYSTFAYCQTISTKASGGSVVTKLSMGIAVNSKSTLIREWVVLNEASCPIILTDGVGINTAYNDPGYRFRPIGAFSSSESITAFEVHHVLYNVFGEHIKTLSNTSVADMNGAMAFDKGSSWYASENQVSEYFACVTYVALVRTSAGKIWRYNPTSIKDELNSIQIKYEEGFVDIPRKLTHQFRAKVTRQS